MTVYKFFRASNLASSVVISDDALYCIVWCTTFGFHITSPLVMHFLSIVYETSLLFVVSDITSYFSVITINSKLT